MRVSCVTRTGTLIHWTKYEAEKLIKPQGVTVRITALETHFHADHTSSNVSPFSAPANLLLPENDIRNSDIHEPDVIEEVKYLVIGENSMKELQLEYSKVLEDTVGVESDEECPLA